MLPSGYPGYAGMSVAMEAEGQKESDEPIAWLNGLVGRHDITFHTFISLHSPTPNQVVVLAEKPSFHIPHHVILALSGKMEDLPHTPNSIHVFRQ